MATEIDPELIARINYEFETFGHMMPETAAKYREAAAAVKNFELKMQTSTAALGALADSFVSYNKAIYKGESVNKAASASLDKLAEAAKYAGAFLALLVPGGPLVKGLVAGIGLLTSKLVESGKLIAEQTDEIYKAYQQMAQVGATGAKGMQDVFDGLQKVGLGTEKFAQYTKMIGENANILSSFGGTVNKGRHKFEDAMEGLTTAQRVEMEQMGLDREAQSQAAMTYVKQQRMLTAGTKEQMNVTSEAIMRYVKETDELTRITGATREEQQKLLDKAMSEEIFASFIDELEAQGEEGKRRAAEVRRANIMAEKLYGPETARGFRDSLTGFVGASKDSQKYLMTFGAEGQEFARNLRETSMSAADVDKGFERLAKQGKDTYDAYRPLAQMGVTSDVIMPIKELRKSGQTLAQNIGQAGEEARRELEDQLKDPKTKEMAKAENKARDTQLMQQRAVNAGMDKYISGVTEVNDANYKLAKSALAAAENLGLLGGKKTAPETTPPPPGTSPGGVGSIESQRAQNAKKEREVVELDLDNARKERERLEAEKGRGAEETKAARIREAEMRREAEKARAAEEHYRRQQSRSMGVSGGAAAGGAAAGGAAAGGAAGGGSRATEVPSAGGGAPTVKISKADGTEETRSGGTKSWRNNNPGNIRAGKWATSQGAIGESGGMAVFPDEETGNKAREALLFGGGDKKYINASIASAMEMYAPRSENDTDKYIAEIVKATGVPANTPLSSLTPDQKSKMLDIMKRHEGWKVGKVETSNTKVAGTDADKPRMADGGIVKANPGGTEVIIGEAGVSEAVIPLKGGAVPVALTMMGGGAGKLINGLDTLIDKELTWAEKVVEVVKTVNPTIRIAAALYETAKNVNAAYSQQTAFTPNADLTKQATAESAIDQTVPGGFTQSGSSIEVINALKESVEVNKAMASMMAEMVQQQKNSNSTQQKMLQVAQN